MMAKATLAVIGAINIGASLYGAAYMILDAEAVEPIPFALFVIGFIGAGIAACAIESLDEGMAAAGDTRGVGVNRPPNKCHIAHDGEVITP
jgi:hypothetical protein